MLVHIEQKDFYTNKNSTILGTFILKSLSPFIVNNKVGCLDTADIEGSQQTLGEFPEHMEGVKEVEPKRAANAEDLVRVEGTISVSSLVSS